MKKVLVIIISLCVLCLNTSPLIVKASNQYARAESSANLYKLTSNTSDLKDIICIIEKSYFVEILNDNGNCYKVNYNGEIGFIKKNDVQLVSNIPNTPFPSNILFILESTCKLRSSPTTKSDINNIITTINSGERNLKFIGRIFADEAIDFGGTTWYYVQYGDYKGYIYNKYIKSITPIFENQEHSYYFNELAVTNTNPIVHAPSLLIIILLLLPTIIILLILYLPRKNKLNSHKKS